MKPCSWRPGNLLIAGGSKEVEVFDPAQGKFLVAAGEMNDARHFLSETRLKDGSVLLAGGYPNNDQATARGLDLQALEVVGQRPRKWLNLSRMAEISHPDSCNFFAPVRFK